MSPILPITLPLAAGLGTLAYATLAPSSMLWGPVIAHGDVSDPPRFAMTFDDGPTNGSTDRVLDLLGELEVKAAFFVIGANLQTAPALVERMHREGHLVCNHSFDHSWLGGLRSRGYWHDQLVRSDDAIEQIIGMRPALFRPPLGIKTWRVISATKRTGHRVIMWSRFAFDGKVPDTQRILRRMSLTKPGDILLLHDGAEPGNPRDQSPTIAAIKPLVQRLRDRGLEPAGLDELIGAPAYQTPHSQPAASAI